MLVEEASYLIPVTNVTPNMVKKQALLLKLRLVARLSVLVNSILVSMTW